jgi:glutathione-independent formaldehyde dehydrogenase
MKAMVYEGLRNVRVKDVPDARIERPTDVLVRITTTNICGSDLHMYEGRTDFETGRWFGHENLGRRSRGLHGCLLAIIKGARK